MRFLLPTWIRENATMRIWIGKIVGIGYPADLQTRIHNLNSQNDVDATRIAMPLMLTV